jgi:hypothetical protein
MPKNRTDTGHGIKGVYEDDALKQHFFPRYLYDQAFNLCTSFRGQVGSEGFS